LIEGIQVQQRDGNPQKKKIPQRKQATHLQNGIQSSACARNSQKNKFSKKTKKNKKCRVAFKFSKALAILKRFLSQLARLRQSPAANSPLFAEQVVMRACGPDSKSYSSAYNIIYHAPARERRKR
jgi:adenylosuccinate lyase